MAAILACGNDPTVDRGRGPEQKGDAGHGAAQSATGILERWGVALSHRGAAALWNLLPPANGPIDVTVFGNGGRNRRAGLRVHRSRTLEPEEIAVRRGIPVTTPARTLADLRAAARKGRKGGVSAKELRRASRQAEYMGLRVGSDPETDRTRSELEVMFLRLCRRTGLTVPEVNVKIGPITVDFLWRDRHLVVETDGYRAHRGRQAFEDDRDRDLRLRSLGYEVVRLSYRQVSQEPEQVVSTLHALLADRKRHGRTLP